MSALASPVRKELEAIRIQTVEAMPRDEVIVVNFGSPAGLRPRLGGWFYTGPDVGQAAFLVGKEKPQAHGLGLARMFRKLGWIKW